MVVRPADTTFVDLDPKRGHSFQGWVTPSGHVVVPVEVGGEPAGCFLVDTGASGLVIDPRLASRLRLPAFGEIFVTGMGGAIRSQFRRAPSLRVGAMVMSDPVLMELPVAPIVAATPETGEVMGILGYDFFRRTVLSVPCAKVGRRDTSECR